MINPAQVYTDAKWDKLEPDKRSELETQYILNNPILMKQIQDKSEWFTVSLEQLDNLNTNRKTPKNIGDFYGKFKPCC
jgi:hypothetical protein